MTNVFWSIALQALLTTLLAILAGKALAGKGTIFPVLPIEKFVFAGKVWIFVTAISTATYLVAEIAGMDASTQSTIAGFLVPFIAGALFVRNRLVKS